MTDMSAKERMLSQMLALGVEAGPRIAEKRPGQYAENCIAEFEKI